MKDSTFFAILVVCLVVLVWFVVSVGNTNSGEYKAVCEASNGKPAYNGRFWGCIK